MLSICFSTFSLVGATTTKTFFIQQGYIQTYSLNLQVGQEVPGEFKIVGERLHYWEDFYFKIIDPNSVTFEDLECVYTDLTFYNFTFTAYTAGYHNITFDNSGQNDRYFELTYTVDGGNLPDASTPIANNPSDPTPTAPELTPILLVIGLVALSGITLIAKKKLKRIS